MDTSHRQEKISAEEVKIIKMQYAKCHSHLKLLGTKTRDQAGERRKGALE